MAGAPPDERQPPPQLPPPLVLPSKPSAQWVRQLQETLLAAAAHGGPDATSRVLPPKVVTGLLAKAGALLKAEPTLLELDPGGQRLTVVGDTHGHYQDLCYVLDTFGPPASDRIWVFNGDFVDRGSWGLEVLTLLLAYKWLLPKNVFLVRGNHEGAFCTTVYGFKQECLAKYAGAPGKALYKALKQQVFAQLPLAAVVKGTTLILHGGLFRAPPAKVRGSPAAKNLAALPSDVQLSVGTLQDLRAASKGGADPDPDRHMSQLIASDVLWSDPSNHPGLHPNTARCVGTTFGPDVTEAFLSHNGLKLIIRSHEGPDARDKRADDDKMPSVDSGYAVDHVTPSGKLVTLFTAPRYPMFMPAESEPFNNRGAVLHLSAPDYCTPVVESFEAVMPRLMATPYYVPGDDACFSESDEESTELSAGASSGPARDAAPAAAAPPGSSTPSSKGTGAPPPVGSRLQQPFAHHHQPGEEQLGEAAAAAVPAGQGSAQAPPAGEATTGVSPSQHTPKRARRAGGQPAA